MGYYWIFLSAVVLADAYIFVHGYDSLFFKCKTDDEKKIRAKLINTRQGDEQ